MHSYLPPRQVSLNLTKCSGARDLTLSFSKSLGECLGSCEWTLLASSYILGPGSHLLIAQPHQEL
jgi:hypothetical protein